MLIENVMPATCWDRGNKRPRKLLNAPKTHFCNMENLFAEDCICFYLCFAQRSNCFGIWVLKCRLWLTVTWSCLCLSPPPSKTIHFQSCLFVGLLLSSVSQKLFNTGIGGEIGAPPGGHLWRVLSFDKHLLIWENHFLPGLLGSTWTFQPNTSSVFAWKIHMINSPRKKFSSIRAKSKMFELLKCLNEILLNVKPTT